MKTWSTEEVKPEDLAPEGDHEHDCDGVHPEPPGDEEVVMDLGEEF